MIGQRFRFVAPFTRPKDLQEHEQNWARIAEAHNSLPIDVPIIVFSGDPTNTAIDGSALLLELPDETTVNIGFKIDDDGLVVTMTPGWYQIAWQLGCAIDGDAGYWQHELHLTDAAFSGFTPSLGGSFYTDGAAGAITLIESGFATVPLLARATFGVYAAQLSGSTKNAALYRLSAQWVRPLDL